MDSTLASPETAATLPRTMKAIIRDRYGSADVLRLLPIGDETFVAELREVLRKRRLAEADPLLQLADRELAFNRKMAQH